MISTKIRLQLEEICIRIQNSEPVSLSEMMLIEKYAKANRTIFDMLQRARRRAVTGPFKEGSMDEFLDQMNIGNPDPRTHITGESSIDDLANFFKTDESNDHMRRD
jgi:hypothetical protein